MRQSTVAITDAKPGDFALFRSGPRRIESIALDGSIYLVQIGTGRIGGRGWSKRTEPNGFRTTLYAPSDLVNMGVSRAYVKRAEGARTGGE